MQLSGTQVDLDATAAPLSEVLDRLARLTGMKLVFDGAPPRPLVTISVHGRSPTQTVLAVFEGLGINYALISDESGVQVQKLLVTGTASPSSSSSRGPSPSMRANRNMPMAPEPVDEPPEDEAVPADEFGTPGADAGMGAVPPDEPPDAQPGGPTNPSAAPTPPPFVPGLSLPTAPGTVQTLQPFPAPSPAASPQGAPPGHGAEGLPFSP